MTEQSPKNASFKNLKVMIVSQDTVIIRMLSNAFKNRGAEILQEPSGQAALTTQKKQKADVVVYSEDVKKGNVKWFTHQVRKKKEAHVKVLWYVGTEYPDLCDGHISRPFRPVDLVKPIFYSLKVYDDLKG